jgi:hypothetical protein
MESWARQPFDRIVDYMRELARFEHVCKYGVEQADRLVLAEQLFQELERLASDDGQITDLKSRLEQLDNFKSYAAEAKEEYEADFPFLHEMGVVGLWSVLEAAVNDFVVEYVRHYPAIAEHEPFARIKVRAGQFWSLDEDSKARLLVEEAARSLQLPDKAGIAYHEALLGTVGVTGPVDESTKNSLYEMSHVRHVIVHRASVADRKLLGACPWLPWSEGQRIRIDGEKNEQYCWAVTDYAKTVIGRIGKLDWSSSDGADEESR